MAIVKAVEEGNVTYAVGGTPEQTFDIPFPFLTNTDLIVLVDAVAQAGLTIVGAGVATGAGTREVTLASPVSNATVQIMRAREPVRVSDFANPGAFSKLMVDVEFDSILMIFQDLRQRVLALDIDSDEGGLQVVGDVYNAFNRRIVNLADPIDPQDAVTLSYLNTQLQILQDLIDQKYLVGIQQDAPPAITADLPTGMFWRETDTGDFWQLDDDGGSRQWVKAGSATSNIRQEITFYDQKTQGTDGGTVAASTRVKRAITTMTSTVPGVTLSANELVGVPAGDYEVEIYVPFASSGTTSVRAWLVDKNGGSPVDLLRSLNAGIGGEGIDETQAVIRGEITLGAATDLYVEGWIEAFASQTYSLGRASGEGPEIYTWGKMRRLL